MKLSERMSNRQHYMGWSTLIKEVIELEERAEMPTNGAVFVMRVTTTDAMEFEVTVTARNITEAVAKVLDVCNLTDIGFKIVSVAID